MSVDRGPHAPHFPDIGVISLVPDDWWRDTWAVRHHVLTRLARYFRVLWMNPPKNWRDVWFAGRASRPLLSHCGLEFPGFTVFDPGKRLPQFYRPRFLSESMERIRMQRARRILTSQGSRKIVLYLWRPEFCSHLSYPGYDVSCYHIDDEYTFSDVDLPIDGKELRLLQSADQVFIHSPALLRKKGAINPNTLFVPNGVDFHAYSAPQSEPGDMAAVPRPRVGYVGILKKQLDFSLLLSLARRHPGWSFVMVGPRGNLAGCESRVRELEGMPNVHFLGRKDVAMLPAYMQHLDVCMLGYEVNDYTNYIFPMKLNEYLACGQHVVGSGIASLLGFDSVIRLAYSAEEWSAALADYISGGPPTEDQVRRRREVARKYDWNALTRQVAEAMCVRLGGTYAERFGRLPREY
jgi:glycosyltransferase involved in cell wall biosynthesis